MKTFLFVLWFCLTLPAYSQQKDSVPELILADPALPEFPGGYLGMKHYLDEQITGRLNLKKIDLDILRSVYARFTLNDSGKVIEAAIIRSSNSPLVDSLFIKALKAMPSWHVPTGHGVTFPIKLNVPYTVLYR